MRKIPVLVSLAWLALAGGSVVAEPLAQARTPVEYPALSEAIDHELQAGLERSLHHLGLEHAVREKRLAVSLVDITDLAAPRLAAVNGDLMMYSASLPKIAILLGAYQKMADEELPRNRDMKRDLADMIRYSSNVAATRVLHRVGPDYLLRLLQSERYRLYDAERKGGLWVGKEYGKGPAYRRDPLYSISHGATVLQVARFYYFLETDRLVSPRASREMKEILGNPGIRHKFVAGLEEITPQANIYRKSGTWRTYHSDSALVEHDGRRYIAVALANDPRGGEWLRRLIVAMDDVVFGRIYKPSAG